MEQFAHMPAECLVAGVMLCGESRGRLVARCGGSRGTSAAEVGREGRSRLSRRFTEVRGGGWWRSRGGQAAEARRHGGTARPQSRAEAGDLNARLQLTTIEEAERALARRPLKAKGQTTLEFLQNPGEGDCRANNRSSPGHRPPLHVEEHEVWRSSTLAGVSSVVEFIRTLTGAGLLQANLVVETHVQLTNAARIEEINKHWGKEWLERMPSDICNPQWRGPHACSKRLLQQIAVTARRGLALESVVEPWKEAVRERTARPEGTSRAKRTPYLIPDDVARTIRALDAGEEATETIATSDHPSTIEASEAEEEVEHLEVLLVGKAGGGTARKQYHDGGPPPKRRRHGESSSKGKDPKTAATILDSGSEG